MNISKNQLKYIRSLSQQKFRKEHQTYIVEGIKNAAEWLMAKADIEYIVALESWYTENMPLYTHLERAKILIATEADFEKISGFKTPNQVLLTAHMPKIQPAADFKDQWTLVLDKVQDPGNMGTIIRTADWFGIKQIVCSPDCVEIYNPKVIQSTMGSVLRMQFTHTNLVSFLETHNEIASYAAILGGSPIGSLTATPKGFIIMGNESKGVSAEVQALATQGITIPRIGNAESLNVAVATGIICNELISS
ncbi:RNA methyltransferase [Taibaiella sp. KBW10]|uniref:TrmH family RNA methyltransferase n=1 Tax=Taibaiella sp. KBW10 TaxID=2153357 RepID=UPI00131566E3|nr:RNA methyltransferase [Taibaiella sp. KBW10]